MSGVSGRVEGAGEAVIIEEGRRCAIFAKVGQNVTVRFPSGTIRTLRPPAYWFSVGGCCTPFARVVGPCEVSGAIAVREDCPAEKLVHELLSEVDETVAGGGTYELYDSGAILAEDGGVEGLGAMAVSAEVRALPAAAMTGELILAVHVYNRKEAAWYPLPTSHSCEAYAAYAASAAYFLASAVAGPIAGELAPNRPSVDGTSGAIRRQTAVPAFDRFRIRFLNTGAVDVALKGQVIRSMRPPEPLEVIDPRAWHK